MSDSTSGRTARVAVSVAFAMQGFLLAALLTQLPSYQTRFQLTESLVVGAVVTVSIIAGAGSIFAEYLAKRTSSKTTLVTGMCVIAAAGATIGVAPTTATFFALLGLYGLGVGVVDAAANMQAVSIQGVYGRFVLSSFHAAWSAGAITGALFVAASAGLGLSPSVTQFTAGFVVAGALAVAGPRFLPSSGIVVATAAPEPSEAKSPALPTRILLAVGGAMALFYAVDFGVANWSAMYLTNVLLSDTGTAALALAAYQCAALLSRTTGDRWVQRFGERNVVRGAALVGLLGFTVVVLAQSPTTAICGFLIVGLGVPIVVPLCFGAAGTWASPGRIDEAVARINLFNYLGTLLGGGVLGALAALTDLRIGFVLPLVFVGALLLLAPAFAPRRPMSDRPGEPAGTVDYARSPTAGAHNEHTSGGAHTSGAEHADGERLDTRTKGSVADK